MANADLTIIIKVQDQASQAMANVEKSTGNLGSKFGALKVAALAGGAALMGGLAVGLKSCVAEAMEAQKVITQTNAVIASTKGISGMTSESVGALADSLSRVIPIDDELIQSTENLLLTFTRIGKDIFPQATEAALNMATALGEDPTNAAIQLGKALQDPILGVTALRRVGVMLTDQQSEMIKKMVEAGDVAGAQKVILKELETEFGNSGRAAGQTAAGQFAILGTQIGNVKESIGMALIPTLIELAGYMINTVIPATQKFGEEWGPKLQQAFTQAKEAIQPVTDAMGKFFGLFEKKDLGLIFAAIAVGIVAGFIAIAVAATAAFVAEHIALLGIPIAVAAAIAALTLLVAHWDAVWAGLQRAPAALLDWLTNNWGTTLLIMAGPAGWLAVLIKNWSTVWDFMPKPVKQALDRVGDVVETVVNAVIDMFNFMGREAVKPLNWLLEQANKVTGQDWSISAPQGSHIGQVFEFREFSGEVMGRAAVGIDRVKKATEELLPPVLNLGDGLGDLGGTGGAAEKATAALTDAEKGLIALLNAFNVSGLSVAQYTTFLDAAQTAMKMFNLTGDQLAAVLQTCGLSAMDFADRIGRLSALQDLTTQAKTAMDAVDELYNAFNRAFAKPTVEEANQNLALAQLKLRRAQLIEEAGSAVSKGEQKKIDKVDAEIAAIQRNIDIRRALQDVDKATLDLADQTKMTDEQQNTAVGMITTAMGTASENAATLAGSLFNLNQSLAQWGLQMRAWVETVTAGHPSAQTSQDIYNALSDEGKRYVDIMAALEGASGRATGGAAAGLTWVGEKGPELLNLPGGSRVYSHAESDRMASQTTIGRQGPTYNIYAPVHITPPADGGDWLAEVERQLR